MRFALYVLALALALAADAALMPALQLWRVSPSATAVVVSFVVLLASRDAAWFAAVLAGFALDLRALLIFDGSTIVVIGPWSLGFAFAAFLVLSVRGALVRRHPVTIGVSTFLFLMSATLVWSGVWAMRSWLPLSLPPWEAGSVWQEYGEKTRWALWSGAIGIPLGWLLLQTVRAWSFPGVAGRTLR